MNSEEIESLFDKCEGEFLNFEAIAPGERRHARKDLCAMLYLHERFGGTGDAVAHAEHDRIWFDWETWKCALTADDALYLTRCGVRYDADNDSFCMFV